MATPPEDVRAGLTLITAAASTELAEVPELPIDQIRPALFDLAPAVVSAYIDGAATLAADWYEDLRAESSAPNSFTPTLITPDRTDEIKTTVAVATSSIRDLEAIREQTEAQINAEVQRALDEVSRDVGKEVSSGFWDTMTESSKEDPLAVGWHRLAQGDACKFCRMLAGKGSVYTDRTVRFAAHTNCSCLAAPSFADESYEPASVMQYVASRRERTAEEKAALRKHLNENFPDAPG